MSSTDDDKLDFAMAQLAALNDLAQELAQMRDETTLPFRTSA